jgi:hypothetical protein
MKTRRPTRTGALWVEAILILAAVVSIFAASFKSPRGYEFGQNANPWLWGK